MAGPEVSMDYSAAQSISDVLRGAGDTLETVAKALEIAANILKATAFFGMVGNLALANYLEGIKPNADKLAKSCHELGMDVTGAIVSLRDGDVSGSQRFV